MKKKFIVYILSFLTFFPLVIFAAPEVNCGNLPGCGTAALSGDGDGVYVFIANIISAVIRYIAVIAVIAIMIGGIMYLVSSGEEEKTSRAKRVIIWALVGVFTSVIAWSLIQILNNFLI